MEDDKVDQADLDSRDQTDESLRAERQRADTAVEEKRTFAEAEADHVVRTARDLADDVVQLARDKADIEHPPSAAGGEKLDGARARADTLLADERSKEDSVIQEQRDARRRYLVDFLAVERDTTDADLSRERSHSDGLVSTRDEFLATVAHDMRNLLSGLGVNATLLLNHAPEGSDGDRMRRHAATSQRLVARMVRLVNDLLDIASIDAGKLSMLAERVDIDKMLRETLDAFDTVAVAKGVVLDGVAAAMPFDVRLDSGRVLQVLANLVSNAIKFTPAGGRVSIDVQPAGTDIQFTVNDTGIGIPEEALAAVFERFRQINKDRRGLGLGLHISKCIVEAHGGRMWAESKLGFGSSFHFSLPASPASSVAPGSTPQA